MSTHTHDNLCDWQPCAMCVETNYVPCRICERPTPMQGTKLCDRCWELESRIRMDPVLAKKILDALTAPVASGSMAGKVIEPYCPDCDNDTRDGVQVPTFDTDWQQAPQLVRRLITEADAEWFWLKGEQAGRIAEQVETRGWLQSMVEGYSERINKC